MAHLQAFSLFLCLASGLAHSLSTPESSLVPLEERISGDHVYHLGGETQYDTFPTDHSHSTTFEARDLFDSDEHSNVADILTRRGPASHENGKVAQHTPVVEKSLTGHGKPLSSAGQSKHSVSALRNIQPEGKIQKAQNWFNPQLVQGFGHILGKSRGSSQSSSTNLVTAHYEVEGMYKRSTAKSSFSQNTQKSPHHKVHHPVTKNPPAGHGKLSSHTDQHKPPAPTLQGHHPLIQQFGDLFTKHHPASHMGGSSNGGAVVDSAVNELYKRGKGSGSSVRSKPVTTNQRYGSGTGKLRINNAVEGSDPYRRDLSVLSPRAQILQVRTAGLNPPKMLAGRPNRSGPQGFVQKGYRDNFALPGSEIYKRDSSTKLISRSEEEVLPDDLLLERGLIFESEANGLYKRDLDVESDKQARSSNMDEPELLSRASKGPLKSQRTSLKSPSNLSRKPSWRPSRNSALYGGGAAQGSVQMQSQTSELYKRYLNGKPSPPVRPMRSNKPNSHGSPLQSTVVIPATTPADDLYKRDLNSDPDYLTLLLEYLDLQNPNSDSLDDSETDDSESDKSSEANMDDDSLEELATSIQTLANDVDTQLVQRTVSPKRPAWFESLMKQRPQTIGSQNPGRNDQRPNRSRPKTKAACTGGFMHGCGESAAKGSSRVQSAVSGVGLSGDDPY